MSQWLTSVVAKIKKLGQGRSAPRPQRQAHPGVEALGGGSSLGGCRRLPVRPEVEQLEERRLMSSSGVISAVTDNHGQTTVFVIGANAQVYELSPAVPSDWSAQVYYGAAPHGWFPLVDFDSTGGFRQVSAGLDGYGRAVCYALHNGDNHVWEMDNYNHLTSPTGYYSIPTGYGFTTEGFDLGWDATQISATRNNECFAIHTHYPSDWVAIYNHSSNSWSAWNGPWGGLMQITTGVDSSGRDQVYLLNTSHQVYRLDHGTYWVLPFQATQISAAAGRNWADTDLFYINPSNSYAYHYDGSTTKLMAMYVSQISAGLDQYGNEVLYSIDMYYRDLWRQDLSGGVEREGGNVSQISAAGNDMVFAVAGWDTSVWVFDRNWNWNSYWASTNNWGSGGWHALNGTTANPYYYAPLAA